MFLAKKLILIWKKVNNNIFILHNSFIFLDFFNQIREDYEKNIFLNVKNELNNCIAKLRIINDDMGKVKLNIFIIFL